jgi:pilus assembly protein CpaE
VNYAVISTDATLRAAVAEALEDGRLGVKLANSLAAPLSSLGRDVSEELRRASVQVVVLDISEDASLGLRFARFLSEEIQGITFVLVGPADVPPALLLEAMRVGASEYLKTPYEYAELAAALGRAARRLGAVPTPEAHEPGRIFAFYAAKGGAGVTTAAANFAIWLKEATHQSTLLLDLDIDMGGSAVVLGLHPRYSFSDFVRNLHRMDRNLLDSLVDHHESGTDVLASPAQPNGSETFTKEQVRSALHYLRRNYENVVIDLARAVNPVTLTALERADDVLLLTTPDLPSLRNTKKVLPLLQRAVQGGNDHIHVVLNRVRPNDVIQGKDVREALGLDVYCSLSSDEDAITESANEGRPVVFRQKSKYSKDIHGLVQQLAAATNGKSANGKGGFLKPFRRSGKE